MDWSMSYKCIQNAEFLTHILRGHSLQFVIFIIKTSVLLSRVLGKKVALLFNGAMQALHCVHNFVFVSARYFNVMHWSAIGLLTKSATFFSCTWFHKFCDFTVKWWVWTVNNTQNVHKKILHALLLNEQVWLNFLSYIKQCQTGTYFFGWVYLGLFNQLICYAGPGNMIFLLFPIHRGRTYSPTNQCPINMQILRVRLKIPKDISPDKK